jgi:hypothetical protein
MMTADDEARFASIAADEAAGTGPTPDASVEASVAADQPASPSERASDAKIRLNAVPTAV